MTGMFKYRCIEYYLDCAKITNQSHEFYLECAFFTIQRHEFYLDQLFYSALKSNQAFHADQRGGWSFPEIRL